MVWTSESYNNGKNKTQVSSKLFLSYCSPLKFKENNWK